VGDDDSIDGATLDDSVVTATGSTTERTLANRFADVVNVMDFGAVGDGVTDDTAAIQAANDYAYNNPTASGCYRSLFFPAGKYLAHELVWRREVSWIGDEVGYTKIWYNGAGGSGSHVIGILASASGAIAFSGFYNMQIDGFNDGDPSGNIAENCIRNLGTGFDWGFKLENIQFRKTFGDAIYFAPADGVTHFNQIFLHRIRFDSVGGYGIYFLGDPINSGAPFVLTDFTMDNNLSGAFLTRATALGYYDGARWGKGVARFDDAHLMYIRVSNARLEFNKKLLPDITGGHSVFLCNNTITSSSTKIIIENVSGTARLDQNIAFVRDTTNRCEYSFGMIGLSYIGRMFACNTAPGRDIGYIAEWALATGNHNNQRNAGIMLSGKSVEVRSGPPNVSSSYIRFSKGSVVLNADTSVGRPIAWTCRYPSSGFAAAWTDTITSAAVVTSGSSTVTIPASTIRTFSPGLAITLVGAGAAGVDLDCAVVSVDETTLTMVVSVVPSTSVDPATIKYDAAEFAPNGYTPGVSADRGNSSITLNLGTDAPTQLFNTPLTADRTVTLSASSTTWLGTPAQANGGKFRIIRTANATGAFNLIVGGIKTLTAAAQWCDVEWNGTAYILTASGTL
jgi:hypothetical protein